MTAQVWAAAAAHAATAAVIGLLTLIASAPWFPVAPRGLRGQPGARTRRWRPWLRGQERPRGAEVDEAVVLDLMRAALSSGADLVTAVEAVAAALPARQASTYQRAAAALRLGTPWCDAWPDADAVVAQALAAAWQDGLDPEPVLRFAAASIRRQRQARAQEAAAALGVRLVLPLGICLLPAFVLLGLVPVMLSAGFSLLGG